MQGEVMTRANKAFFMVDMMGHGYSEGVRAYIQNYQALVNDMIDVIKNVMSLKEREESSFHCDLSEEVTYMHAYLYSLHTYIHTYIHI